MLTAHVHILIALRRTLMIIISSLWYYICSIRCIQLTSRLEFIHMPLKWLRCLILFAIFSFFFASAFFIWIFFEEDIAKYICQEKLNSFRTIFLLKDSWFSPLNDSSEFEVRYFQLVTKLKYYVLNLFVLAVFAVTEEFLENCLRNESLLLFISMLSMYTWSPSINIKQRLVSLANTLALVLSE